jgi:hypothetical protein
MTSDLMSKSSWADQTGTDLASVRAEADRAQHEVERLKAARVIASAARDTDEARDLLAMLGIGTEEVRSALDQRTAA